MSVGGTCEFFLSCWLGGGLLEGACSGLLRGCCRRGLMAADKTGPQAIGTQPAPYEHQPKAISLTADKTDNSKSLGGWDRVPTACQAGDNIGGRTYLWYYLTQGVAYR